jgi:hypothetical protein
VGASRLCDAGRNALSRLGFEVKKRMRAETKSLSKRGTFLLIARLAMPVAGLCGGRAEELVQITGGWQAPGQARRGALVTVQRVGREGAGRPSTLASQNPEKGTRQP